MIKTTFFISRYICIVINNVLKCGEVDLHEGYLNKEMVVLYVVPRWIKQLSFRALVIDVCTYLCTLYVCMYVLTSIRPTVLLYIHTSNANVSHATTSLTIYLN